MVESWEEMKERPPLAHLQTAKLGAAVDALSRVPVVYVMVSNVAVFTVDWAKLQQEDSEVRQLDGLCNFKALPTFCL